MKLQLSETELTIYDSWAERHLGETKERHGNSIARWAFGYGQKWQNSMPKPPSPYKIENKK